MTKKLVKINEFSINDAGKIIIDRTKVGVKQLLPNKWPIEVKAVFKQMEFMETRDQSFQKLVARFPAHTKTLGSIIINNALYGAVYNQDYWITAQDNKPLFQFQAKGLTKLLQTHSTPAYKLENPMQTGVIYRGEQYVFDQIKGIISHSVYNDKRTEKLDDIVGAYAQYKTVSGTMLSYFLSRSEIDQILTTSAGYQKELDKLKQNPSAKTYSPWINWPTKMCIVKAIKGLCKVVQHSGGFDFSKAIIDYLSQDEMLIDEKGRPLKSTYKKSKSDALEDTQIDMQNAIELDKLCSANQKMCEKVMNKYYLDNFYKAKQKDYEDIKKLLLNKGEISND